MIGKSGGGGQAAFCLVLQQRSDKLCAMLDLQEYLRHQRKQVDDTLEQWLPATTVRPQRLHEAMRYSIFAGGKRLRPILCMASARAVAGVDAPGLVPGAAVECLHTYTLIHDDLPAMDDDDLRRGKPTSHKVYGEAMAVLAGDALLTFAFELLASVQPRGMYTAADMIRELAQAAGSCGVVGGQVEDLAAEGRAVSEEQLQFIHDNKTARLIRASCLLGAMAAGAAADAAGALAQFGMSVGLAFQYIDDILDEISSSEVLGKPVGSDQRHEKMTAVRMYGLENTRSRAAALTDQATALLERFGEHKKPLAAIARYMLERTC